MAAQPCPRCGEGWYTPYTDRPLLPGMPPYPALSRVARIYICSACGTAEALRDFHQLPPVPPDEWPVPVREGLDP